MKKENRPQKETDLYSGKEPMSEPKKSFTKKPSSFSTRTGPPRGRDGARDSRNGGSSRNRPDTGRGESSSSRPPRAPRQPAGVALRASAVEKLVVLLSPGRDQGPSSVSEENPKSTDRAPVRRFSLSPEDTSLEGKLISQTLRYHGVLSEMVKEKLHSPLRPGQEKAALIIEIGLVQLLLLSIPDHAALSTTVALCEGPLSPCKGLVNAILRGAQRNREALQARLQTSKNLFPDWISKKIESAYGSEMVGELTQLLKAEPPLSLTFRSRKEREVFERKEADQADKKAVVPVFEDSLVYQGRKRLEALWGFKEGAFWVQDVAASLPVRLLAPQKGETVYDLCAAPGGKTLQLAARGASVVAVDQAKGRVHRLKENLTRTMLSAEIVISDVLSWTPKEQVAKVLLDAPCSALGTFRKNPEVLWRRQEENFEDLLELQADLLEKAASFVQVGGQLVYAVCSFLPEEGEAQVAEFLKNNPHFSLKGMGRRDAKDQIRFGTSDKTPQAEQTKDEEGTVFEEGAFSTLPSMTKPLFGRETPFSVDCFYIASLVRKS